MTAHARFSMFFALSLFLLPCGTSSGAAQTNIDSHIYDLKNPNPDRRKNAAIALGNAKAQRAVPDLLAGAEDADAGVRREIVVALDKMRDVRSLPAFVKLSSDPEKDIREGCIHGIIDLYLAQESGLSVTFNKVVNFVNLGSDEWADVVVEPDVSVDPSAVIALRGRLKDTDEGLRIKAARSLGILKGKEALPELEECLNQDRSNAVRFEIARSLRKIGDRSASKDLLNFVGYTDTKVRNEALYGVGRLRDPAAVPELTRLYERESSLTPKKVDKTYRELLLDALAFIAAPPSKGLFLKEAQNPEANLRLHAVEGLARLGDPEMVESMSRDRLHEQDVRIQTAQAYALFRMGRKEYVDELVGALANKKSNQVAKIYLVEFKPQELPKLYAQVKNKDVSVREGIAETLGLIGGTEAISTLQELSKDNRGEIAVLANQGMRRISARTAAK